jgi:hypothetical protein
LEGGGLGLVEILSRSLPGGTEKTHRKTHSVIFEREPGGSMEYIISICRVRLQTWQPIE